jgi:hypothetical protein
MKTRSHASAPPTLVSLPNDALRQVIAACGYYEGDVPLFETVKGLGCLSKGMRQQLYRLQPLVGVQSLAVVQRSNHGPWRITLLYEGDLTASVEEQARQGRVRSINASLRKLYPAVAERVVPDLLGEGCSLLELDLSGAGLKGSWSAVFGEAALCSAVLRALYLNLCKLSGPLPELRLPALQVLDLSNNQWTGGLEPLRGCTSLFWLEVSGNFLTGSLEPLRGCTALEELSATRNRLTGDLEPLRGRTALKELRLANNELTGGLGPLRSCTSLQWLELGHNQLTGGLEPLRGCTALAALELEGNQLTGSLEPLQG